VTSHQQTRRPSTDIARALTIVVAAAYGVWMFRLGPQTAMDTKSYSEWADQMIAHHFNIAAYLADHTFVAPPVLYLLWILIVAALKIALGSWWMHGVLVLNWLSFTTGAYATLTWIGRITASSTAMLLAAALLCVAADLLIFAPFVLSDLTFWGISTGIVVTGLAMATSDDEHLGVGRLVIGSALVAIALVFRPVALPLAMFWVMTLIARVQRERVVRAAPTWLGVLCVLTVAAVMLHAYGLMEPAIWIGRRPAIFELLAREFREGILVYAPGGTSVTVAPATSWLGFLAITIQKWIYFWSPWLPHYSLAHSMMNIAFFAPTYALGAIAWWRVRRLSAMQQLSVYLLLSLALLISAFHAMTLIDYDHRYRLPLLPVLIMLATLGLEALRRPARMP
jgi:hypothetical protein